jgi:hypothetical protein
MKGDLFFVAPATTGAGGEFVEVAEDISLAPLIRLRESPNSLARACAV